MKKAITAIMTLLVSFQLASAETGTEKVRRHFNIEKTVPVNENLVRNAILQIVPLNTTLKETKKRLERAGVDYNQTCAPGDTTPLWCKFPSPKDQVSEATYTVEFFFDKHNQLRNIEVVRSYRNKAKRFTSYPTKPATDLILKNNLNVGSPVKKFDETYGAGELNTSTDFANDWPLTLEYHDREKNRYFYVGVEVGEMSPEEMKTLQQDRSRLAELKAGIIFVDWPDPLLGK